MIVFKPKINHQKPIKPLQKADFNAYFAKKWMIFTLICKIHATPKGPLWVRFPPGVPKQHPALCGVLFWYFTRGELAARKKASPKTKDARRFAPTQSARAACRNASPSPLTYASSASYDGLCSVL